MINKNEILESDRLILRPFSINDIEDVYMYANDDNVTKYLTWETHKDLSQTQKIVKEFYINNPGIYAIEIKSEHKSIGCIDLRLDSENNKGSFGYVLNKNYWNQGLVLCQENGQQKPNIFLNQLTCIPIFKIMW